MEKTEDPQEAIEEVKDSSDQSKGTEDPTEESEGQTKVTEGQIQVTEGQIQVTEGQIQVTEGQNQVTEGQAEKDEPTKPVLPEGMSRNQMKKMLKRQRWLDQKTERRAYERQKKKDKRQAMKDSGEALPPGRKRLKRNSMKNSSCQVKVAIDCSFDDLMTEKDICQLVQQLNHCYAANRRVEDPLQFYITSLSGKAKDRLDSLGDYKGWDVYTETADYEEVFGKDKVVYLSSESPNILTTMDPDKAYIIGGLVDHNHQKGLCYRLAQEKGIAHAQLPIGEYLQLNTRKVLTINHVFEILVQFTQTQSWEEAFFKVIPNRKVSSFKSSDNKIKEKESSKEETGLNDEKPDTSKSDEENKELKSKDQNADILTSEDKDVAEKDLSSDSLSHQGATGTEDTSAPCIQNVSTNNSQEVAPPSDSPDREGSKLS